MSDACPHCFHTVDAHTAIYAGAEIKPEPGDVTVCLYCQAFLQFDSAVKLQPMTAQEVEALPLSIQTALVCARKAIQARGCRV